MSLFNKRYLLTYMFCLIVQSYGQHRVIQSYFIFEYLQSNIRRKDVSIPNATIYLQNSGKIKNIKASFPPPSSLKYNCIVDKILSSPVAGSKVFVM